MKHVFALLAACATGGLALAAESASVESIWGLSRGEHAAQAHSAETMLDAKLCSDCHHQQHAEWSVSAHGRAWTNDLFQEGFAREPLPLCVHCHAPLAEQAAEVAANREWYLQRGPQARDDGLLRTREPEPLADQGVGCAVCHVRNGAVLTPDAAPEAPHPVVVTAALRDTDLCKDCHEFPIHDALGQPSLVMMQSTWSEWSAWREAGGAETCQSCHMPGASHNFRGSTDTTWLAASVQVEVRGGEYTLSTVGVGHSFPTGDLFRHLTLEEQRGDQWVQIAWIGRRFQVHTDEAGRPSKRLAEDSSLTPGERRIVTGEGGSWRLRYHYTNATEEAAGRLPIEDLVITLHQG